MTILSIIESATGNTYRNKSAIHGGEYAGPCPWCGGTDRFSIHPAKDHYVCRQCKKSGDSITFLKDHQRKSYINACKILNISPNIQFKALNTATEKPGQNELVWTPREPETPSLTWQNKAEAVLFEAYKYLLSASGKKHRDWLNNRGISNDTIKQARLGWNNAQIFFDPETWALQLEKSKNEKKRQIWIPEGLIIPYFQNGKPIRLRIRQEKPVTNDRFILVAGSSTAYFDYNSHIKTLDTSLDTAGIDKIQQKPALITESELDGWLLHQELSDLFQVFAIGNASSRPDLSTHQAISSVPRLLNLDDDQAGHIEAAWWSKQYSSTILYFSDMGKDPGEDFEAGVDIRSWGMTGLEKLSLVPNTGVQTVIIQNFKADVLKQLQKPVLLEQKIQAQATVPVISTSTSKPVLQICMHGKYCPSLQNNICLIDQQFIQAVDKDCPKEKWTKHISHSGIITEYILGPGVKK